MNGIVLTPNLTLDPITVHNAADVLPLMQACYPPVYAHLWADEGDWYVPETYRPQAVLNDLTKKNAHYWIVRWKTEAVGIFRLLPNTPCPDFPGEPGYKVHRIYLHPRTHGRGIGRTLMDYAERRARTGGYTCLWLEAMDTQTAALGFYEKLGYTTTGTFRLTFERMHDHLRGMLRMGKRIYTPTSQEDGKRNTGTTA